MIKEALAYLMAQAEYAYQHVAPWVDGEGRYKRADGVLVPIAPLPTFAPDLLHAGSLSEFVAYVNENPDGLDLAGFTVVADQGTATLFGKVEGEQRNRHQWLHTASVDFLTAMVADAGPRWYMPDQFVLHLTTRFVPTDPLRDLLSVVGNMKTESTVETEDDGVGQKVATHVGINTSTLTKLPSPLELVPMRTFDEVEQAPHLFVVRARRASDGMPELSLSIADGKRGAMENGRRVRQYLRDNVITEGVVVL